MKDTDTIIVGAGAAGLVTAIFAARRMPQRSIVLVDGSSRPGAKILMSGGGRCNVTNRAVSEADYCGLNRHSIRKVLQAFPVERTIAFFHGLGVELHEEEDGKLFPDNERSSIVLDRLLRELDRLRVPVLLGHKVTNVSAHQQGFNMTTSSGELHARQVVLATGGISLPKTGSDGSGLQLACALGHTLVPTTPALVPLVLEGDFHQSLSGISQQVTLTLEVDGRKVIRMAGSMLWTHWGVSGPVVLDMSRHWYRARIENRPVALTASFLSGESFEMAESRMLDLTVRQPRVSLGNALAARLPSRLADAVLSRLTIDGRTPLAHLSREVRRQLIHSLLEWPLPVIDSRGYEHAEVTAGGIPLDEIDAATMASRRCPGLYLVGEILDADGRIGGFNFQWAWATAWAASNGLLRAGPEDRVANCAD